MILPERVGLVLSLPTPSLCLLASAIGVAAHLGYFIRGYRVFIVLRIIILHSFACLAVVACEILHDGLSRGLLRATAINACYFVGLFTSMTIYRLYFHRLSRFPGPFAAKITKLYGPWISRTQQPHLVHTELHKKYGNFVRIAPNELLVNSPDLISTLLGFQSRCTKDQTIYETFHVDGWRSVQSILTRNDHRWRRKVWDQAFTNSALDDYEVGARDVMHRWLAKLDEMQGEPVNTTMYSFLIPFENMGSMGFSHRFGAIEAGQKSGEMQLLKSVFGPVGRLGQLYWPIVLGDQLGLSKDFYKFLDMAGNLTDRRSENGLPPDAPRDIMSYLLEDFHSGKSKTYKHVRELQCDGAAIIIAGAETLAGALAFMFRYVAADPHIRAKLRAELEPLFGKTLPGEFAARDLEDEPAPYLNAVIAETLRIQNPATNTSVRLTPPEGIFVDGVHIPGGTEVLLPVWSLQRDERYFERPSEFVPERWTTRPEMVKDRRVYLPFVTGPNNCVGKRVAMVVLRFTLAYTVMHYEFEFAPGEDGKACIDEAVDSGTITAGKLYCTFRRREV